MRTFFTDTGEPTPVVGFEFPDDTEDDTLSPMGDTPPPSEIAARLIALLCEGSASCELTGRRVLLLAYCMRLPNGPKSQRELARRMALSPARVNAIVRTFRRELHMFRDSR